jgi:hypothetical protein
MKVIYIAGPFRGVNTWEVEQNVRRAESVAFAVALTGAMPLCPHTNTRFFNGTITAEFWLRGTLELLRRADAVVLVAGWEKSIGTRAEIVEADKIGIPVFEFLGKEYIEFLEGRSTNPSTPSWPDGRRRG